MSLTNRRDLYAGLLFLAFGLGFLIYAQDYSLGNSRRMGPAFFPSLLAVVQILCNTTMM